MGEAVTAKLRHRLLILVALLAAPAGAFAHRLDEYLQATLVVIEPGEIRLEMNLTPGVAVADQVLAQIHPDNSDTIPSEKAAAYAESLRRDLTVRLDQRLLTLRPTASQFSTPAELRTGSGMIQVEFTAGTGAFEAGAHTLTIQNRHLPAIGVYLFNAGQPSFFATTPSKLGSIEITAQKRNTNQSEGEIDFAFHPPPQSFHHPRLVDLLAVVLVGVAGLWFAGKHLPRLAGALPGRVRTVDRKA
jgi:hypothetical protein